MNTVRCNIFHKRFDFNDIIDYVLNIYNIDGIQLHVLEDQRTVDRFSNDDIQIDAMTISYSPEMYVIFVRPGCLSPSMLCHELIHLHQYYRGDLVMLNAGRSYTWKGIEYNNKTDYFSRPWEIEAFRGQNKLYKAYKKYKKTINQKQK